MPTAARRKPGSERQARSTLRTRLEARRAEIEQGLLTRVNAIADSSTASDPAYVEGLRSAVDVALGYGLDAIEAGEDPGPPPIALLAQARMAARAGVSLDTVLRRYFASYSLLGYFIIEEATGILDGAELQRLLGTQAVVFDRLLAAIAEEHSRESGAFRPSSEQRRAERIECLLDGELVDTADIGYDFEGWHLGIVACGAVIEEAIRELSARLDYRPLFLGREEGTFWVWLGARRRPDPAEILESLSPFVGTDDAIALGEPCEALSGWRLTHRQAATAFAVARQGSQSAVRYAEVAIVASALHDDLLKTSLRHLYLEPLQKERDGGAGLRRTLLAYFECERNSASAASALGVTRQTVNNRLRLVEERIGRPLASCAGELEIALRLPED